MSDHMSMPLDELAKAILEDGVVDAAEVTKIKERVYADGVVDREEADFLFQVNDGVSGKDNDPGWKALFVEALTKHVLGDEASPDEVDDGEADYLIAKIKGDGVVDDVEMELLVTIIATAAKTGEKLQQFVLESLKARVLEDGIIDDDEVAMIRKVIYGRGGGAGEGVDRAEADFLFELNDAVTGKSNAPAWKDLLVEAVTKHVLEDEATPGEVDEDEAAWLISKVEGDDQVDETEKALLANIKAKAKSLHESLTFKLDIWQI